MRELEVLLALVLAAVILAALARRAGAPYPVFLAIGGALLALLPGAPSFTLPPELVLALFIAPVLLDAAYDASLRDLRDKWAGLTEVVVVAVAGGGGFGLARNGSRQSAGVKTRRRKETK